MRRNWWNPPVCRKKFHVFEAGAECGFIQHAVGRKKAVTAVVDAVDEISVFRKGTHGFIHRLTGYVELFCERLTREEIIFLAQAGEYGFFERHTRIIPFRRAIVKAEKCVGFVTVL